jgi:hypothetical protein
MRKSEVGEARPSQTLTTYGIGSIVDLPNMSVMVMGLDDWPISHATEIAEERLLRSAQSILGPQVSRFLTPPRGPESQGAQTNWFDESRQIGIPVAPFPRWMVCTKCRLLAPISSGLFEPKVYPYRPDRAGYVHNCSTQGRAPMVVPARFMVTCEHGHLDDFPWVYFVHNGTTDCKGRLYLYEVGASGEALDVEIKCDGCGTRRRMGQAFGLNNRSVLPPCRGRRPHLRDCDPNGCDQKHVKPMLQGASNLWFPVLISALSVPQAEDDLGRLIEDNWAVLEKATTIDVLKAFRMIGQLKDLSKYDDDTVWSGIQKKNEGADVDQEDPDDLKSPEWRVFSNPSKAKPSRNFKLRAVDPPTDYASYFEKIVLVEKLREVRALVGFTRIMSPRDFDSAADLPPENRARISRTAATWLPASETRGEGIFFQFYSRNPDEGDPMAGVLIYTAASDSEGTLGGLCALGEPDKLGRHIRRALEKMRLCASDPLCSEHTIGSNDTLHGASCHACSFLPETSCERGNKYLDRAVLVPTFQSSNLVFFR